MFNNLIISLKIVAIIACLRVYVLNFIFLFFQYFNIFLVLNTAVTYFDYSFFNFLVIFSYI